MTKIKLPTACYHRSTALGPCASCVDRHVDEVADASRDCVAHIAGPITADDWQGMYHIAARRAVEAEDRIRCLTAELAAYRGRDTRVCLHCGRAQEKTT